jgi:hypothetical protein
MRLFSYIALCLFLHPLAGFAQQIPSPESLLGYSIGENFTFHYKVESYFNALDAASDKLLIQPYGSSYEGRPLFVAIISHASNIRRYDEIRKRNRRRAGLEKGDVLSDQPVIVWLSYNIHGNEAVSTETAMLSAYELISNPAYEELLKNTIIVIDPCLNPDGHTRYVQFYTEKKGVNPDVSLFSEEHQEKWPGGRPNHYLFDLNRDWAWQTQKETQERIALLNAWLPQVHVDFHEMGIDDPYFFSPAADPYHEDVTPWQKEFQVMVGKHLGREFDQRDWLYFTSEVFDLFYPSYGDTYPTYNGAIGMTYEQGGSGRAGLAVLTGEGDTLTLTERIKHHHIAGLQTIEVAYRNKKRLLDEFQNYFTASVQKPSGKYKSYIIKENHKGKMDALTEYLRANEIRFSYAQGAQKGVSGFGYKSNKDTTFTIEKGDIILSAFQPKSRLLKILFEPNTHLSDSNTYDITAWALPYAWQLDAYASATNIQISTDSLSTQTTAPMLPADSTIAIALLWKDLADAKFLAEALKKGYEPRISEKEIQIGTTVIPRGSPIFLKKDIGSDGLASLANEAASTSSQLISLQNSFPEKGPSFGSGSVRKIKAPRVGLVSGEGFSPYEIGEIWHLFEQELKYPIHRIQKEYIREDVLKNLDVLFVTSFYDMDWWSETRTNALKAWVRSGGRLILIENAVAMAAQKGGFQVKIKKDTTDKDTLTQLAIKPYAEMDSDFLSRQNPGSIFRVQLDPSFPLAYGYTQHIHLLKTNKLVLDPIANGNQVGIHTRGSHVSGFIGHKIKEHIESGMSIGVESMGRGQIVYFADNPIFRSFWRSGKLMVANAAFLLP